MILLRIALVVMGFVFLTAEGVKVGLCKECGCINPICDFPKTKEECQACANVGGKSSFSMEGGHCRISIGITSEGDCAIRTYSKLLGCSGFNGYSHDGRGNQTCWARWRPSTGRSRRDVLDFWENTTL